MSLRWNQLCVVALVLPCIACESNKDKRPPEAPNNTDHVSYATEYPEEVDRVTKEIDEGKAKAAEQCAQFPSYAEQIKDPTDGEKVAGVYEAAEQSGKSGEYAQRARQNRAFSRMLEEDDGSVGKSLVGTVHGAATQDGCPNPGNVSGAANAGLKRGMEKRQEDRLRETNEAHRLIKRNKKKLGKDNVGALEKQADEIANASYIANVELPELKYELEQLIQENDKVIKTIDREIEEEKKLQKDADDEEKKESDERIKELEATKAKLEEQKGQLEERKKQLEQLQKDIKQVQDDCKKALDDLKSDMKKREGGGGKSDDKKSDDKK